MATSLNGVVYPRFLSKVSDYEWADYEESELEDELLDYLYTAMSDFKFCKQDLGDLDVDEGQFNIDLTNDEIEILTDYMVLRWINTKHVNRQTLLKQALPSKDYNLYSPANHLKALLDLRDRTAARVERLRSLYSYGGFDVNNFLRGG